MTRLYPPEVTSQNRKRVVRAESQIDLELLRSQQIVHEFGDRLLVVHNEDATAQGRP
jgi:hypothetical protein